MIYRSCVLCVLGLMLSFAEARAQNFVEQQDKQLHFAASAGLSMSAYGYFRWQGDERKEAYIKAMIFAIAIGASKEVFVDDRVDTADLGADVLGAGSGLVIPFFWDF